MKQSSLVRQKEKNCLSSIMTTLERTLAIRIFGYQNITRKIKHFPLEYSMKPFCIQLIKSTKL